MRLYSSIAHFQPSQWYLHRLSLTRCPLSHRYSTYPPPHHRASNTNLVSLLLTRTLNLDVTWKSICPNLEHTSQNDLRDETATCSHTLVPLEWQRWTLATGDAGLPAEFIKVWWKWGICPSCIHNSPYVNILKHMEPPVFQTGFKYCSTDHWESSDHKVENNSKSMGSVLLIYCYTVHLQGDFLKVILNLFVWCVVNMTWHTQTSILILRIFEQE